MGLGLATNLCIYRCNLYAKRRKSCKEQQQRQCVLMLNWNTTKIGIFWNIFIDFIVVPMLQVINYYVKLKQQ